MCGGYSFFQATTLLRTAGKQRSYSKVKRHYNAAPSQELPVILNTGPESIVAGKWGSIPHWMKNPKGIINARAETICEKPSFRKAATKQHCLVLADSFFEWNRKATTKIPYRILLKNEAPFVFAGIWEMYQTATGTQIPSFSIITVPANDMMSELHDRMPVILPQKYEQLWIDTSSEPEASFSVLKPYPDNEMQMVPDCNNS